MANAIATATIQWANETAADARRLAVNLAKHQGICRICLEEPTMPLRLDFGKEYACEKCLEGRERI